MSNLVIDYLTKDEIYISKKRNKRPVSYKNVKNEDYKDSSRKDCPFCLENKNLIDKVILHNDNIRVIENKYPIADLDDGKHEVLIEHTDHCLKLYDYDNTHCIKVFETLQKRYNELIKQYNHINIFKNEGFLSGATLYHSHWQIIALNNDTSRNRTIYSSFLNYFNSNNKDYFNKNNEDILVVKETDNIIAFAPKYSRSFLLVRIFTKRKISSFKDVNNKELKDLALTVKDVLNVYKDIFEDFSYNILFQDFDNRENGYFYIEVTPRLGKFGGFELSSSTYTTSHTGVDSKDTFKKYFK